MYNEQKNFIDVAVYEAEYITVVLREMGRWN